MMKRILGQGIIHVIENSNLDSKMKGKVRVKKDDFKLILTLMICQIGVLAIGWVVMSSHVGTETDFNITEPALKEPYFSWINTFITIYWGVGILVSFIFTKLY